MVRGIVAAMLAVGVVSAQEPTFDVVMSRAADYVARYQAQLRGLVAEEHYRQNLMSTASGRLTGDGTPRKYFTGRRQT